MAKIKKMDLIAHMMATQNMDYEQTDQFLAELAHYITENVVKGHRIYYYQLGLFYRGERKARLATNPHTGETVQSPAHYVPQFKASKNFKDRLKKMK